MPISRRSWLSMTAAGAIGAFATADRLVAAQPLQDVDLTRRIRRVIEEYGQQGFHRTGTTVDRRSGDWLFEQVSRLGIVAAREPFSLSRVDPGTCRLLVGDRSVEGLPLFDGTFTGEDGVRGRLGPIDADTEIGLVDASPNTAAAGPLGEARRLQRHKAIVCVTRGGRAGLCPNNADAFLRPFGPPVLQVSSVEWPLLRDAAERRAVVQLIASVTRMAATGLNITAKVTGVSRTLLPPLVVMTPRSGWYTSSSERGGGIACWLELMRVLQHARPPRDILFVASSGHELGHLGIDAFVARRPGIVSEAVGWMHFGANIGAAIRPDAISQASNDDPERRHAAAAMASGNTIQASDDRSEAVLSRAMLAVDLGIQQTYPEGHSARRGSRSRPPRWWPLRFRDWQQCSLPSSG